VRPRTLEAVLSLEATLAINTGPVMRPMGVTPLRRPLTEPLPRVKYKVPKEYEALYGN